MIWADRFTLILATAFLVICYPFILMRVQEDGIELSWLLTHLAIWMAWVFVPMWLALRFVALVIRRHRS
jgi:hypothetical protein